MGLFERRTELICSLGCQRNGSTTKISSDVLGMNASFKVGRGMSKTGEEEKRN